MDETYKIVIRNYEKFNARNDIKRPWWFKFSNTFLEDPDFYRFAPEELIAWIYIMCQASKQKSARIEIDSQHAQRTALITFATMRSCISKLSEKGIISVSRTDHVQIPTGTRTDHGQQTREEKRREEKNNTIAHFGKCATECYFLYPKKIGKRRGMDKLKMILKSEEDVAKMKIAIDRYAKHCQKEKLETRFIKHFDSFLSSWEDWLDPNVGKVEMPKKPKEIYRPPEPIADPRENSQMSHDKVSELLASVRVKTL